MKKWNRPSLFVLSAKQLDSAIYAFANSDCIRKFIR